MENKQTAVDWFYDKIKSHFEHDGDLLETLRFTMSIAKQKEREQHCNTCDALIKAHDSKCRVLLKEQTTREIENAKYANQHCVGTAERILSLFSSNGYLTIDFVKWCSGMEKEKILKAYECFIKNI